MPHSTGRGGRSPRRWQQRFNYRGITTPATQRVCAYRLGCVAEITAFRTVDVTRFGVAGAHPS
jgi:hypothetical protein